MANTNTIVRLLGSIALSAVGLKANPDKEAHVALVVCCDASDMRTGCLLAGLLACRKNAKQAVEE